MLEKHAQEEKRRLGKLVNAADRECSNFQLIRTSRIRTRNSQGRHTGLRARTRRLKHGPSNEVAELVVRCMCANRGINVSYSFDNGHSDGITPEAQTAVAPCTINRSFASSRLSCQSKLV